MKSLQLTEPAVLIGHSLGGYVALEYARRVSAWTRGLILVSPFYSRSQLSLLLRNAYGHPRLNGLVVDRIPEWLFRIFVDVSSIAMGHSAGALYSLPEKARLDGYLAEIDAPTLVVWGDRDRALAPASFPRLVKALPKARAELLRAGHVPHQSDTAAFNEIVLKFLKGLP
jgi:pimeloyl-ACP methyl ester carboxylesterase